MKRLTSAVGILAAFVVAVLVIPVGTVGAKPLQSVDTGGSVISIAPSGESITVKLRDGVFAPNKATNEVKVVNSRGVVTETVPLTLRSEGATTRIASTVSADRKTATFTALDRRPVAKKAPSKRMTRDQAYMKMMYQLNKDWPCAAPYIIGGVIIGFLFIVGFIIGGLIGAYIGYTTCNRGAAWNAVVNWWNTP